MQVPNWLLSVVTTCLEKKPEKRFSTGVDLHEAIIRGSMQSVKSGEERVNSATVLNGENERLLGLVRHYQERTIDSERDVAELRAALTQKETELRELIDKARSQPTVQPRPADPSARLLTNRPDGPLPAGRSTARLSKTALLTGIIGLACLVGWFAYSRLATPVTTRTTTTKSDVSAGVTPDARPDEEDVAATSNSESRTERKTDTRPVQRASEPVADRKPTRIQTKTENKPVPERTTKPPGVQRDPGTEETTPDESVTAQPTTNAGVTRYAVASRYAYFHNEPDETTRRTANINIWNNARLTPLDERNGFIYVVYVNEQGQTSRGWLLKRNLRPLNR